MKQSEEDMQEKGVWVEEYNAYIEPVSEEELVDMLRKEFPDGMTVTVRDESVENLLEYENLKDMDFGDEDWVGYINDNCSMLKVYGDLKAVLKLKPEDYDAVYADDQTYWAAELSDDGWDTGYNATSLLVHEARTQHDGSLHDARVSIPSSAALLDRLFIEDRPYKEVLDIIKQHNITRDSQLLRVFALQDVYKNGFGTDKTHYPKYPSVLKDDMKEVEQKMKHMYVGEDRDLEQHAYYEQDIYPVFENECRQQAEIILMKEGYMECVPHNLIVDYANMSEKKNHWEATEMMDSLRRHYGTEDCTVSRDDDRLTVSVHTTDPQKQVDIRNFLTKSWAQKGWWRKPYDTAIGIKDEAHYFITADGQAVKGWVRPQQVKTDNVYSLKRDELGRMDWKDWKFISADKPGRLNALYTDKPLVLPKDGKYLFIEEFLPEKEVEAAMNPDRQVGYVAAAGGFRLRMTDSTKSKDSWYMSKPLYEIHSRIFKAAMENTAIEQKMDNLETLARCFAAMYYKQELQAEQGITNAQEQSKGFKR